MLLSVVYPLSHGAVSALSDAAVQRVGFLGFDRGAAVVLGGGIAGLILAGLWRGRRRDQIRSWGAPAALAVVTASAAALLVVAWVELIHLPQYAVLVALWLAAGVRPIGAWVLAVLAGVGDELYQHLVLYAGRADTYLDWNDMVLNALGATWMVCLWRPIRAHPGYLGPSLVLAGVVAVGAVAGAVDPALVEAVTGKVYRRLSAVEAVAWLAVLMAVLSLRPEDPERSRIGADQPPAG